MAEPPAQDIKNMCILLAPELGDIQYIDDDVILQGTAQSRELQLDGPLEDDVALSSCTLFMTAIPFTTIGAITLSEYEFAPVPYPVVGIYSGNTPSVDNGQVIFGDVDVAPSQGYPNIDVIGSNKIIGQTDVFQSFRTEAQLQVFVQGSVNDITFSKTIFSYLFIEGQPNIIQFRNPLFVNGMIFLKDENGLSDLPATMVLTELDQPEPLLTITGIPVVDGRCPAMIIVV